MRYLSPVSLVTICWGLSGLATYLTLARLQELDLVQTFLLREHLTLSAFEATGLVWLLLAFFVYCVADLAGRFTRSTMPRSRPLIDITKAARLTFAFNCVLLGVTALWIATAAAKAGGLINLAAAAYLDSLTTRDLLLENKLFVGMRLFYAALPATACLAAALLAKGGLTRRWRTLMTVTLLGNTLALFVLPIVMSQRLLLLQLLASAYIAACLVRGRLFGLGWLTIGAALFLGLWMAREAITNPMAERSAFDIGTQKMAFYVVNDMWNAFAPLARPIPHTFGGLNLEGVMFLTFTDGYFLRLLSSKLEDLDAVLGGGEFPFFTAAYVDFGAVFGLAFIAAVGFLFRRVYARAQRSFGWAVVYGQIGAALLFSSHSVYFTHQNFLFSLLLIGAVVQLSLVRPARVPRPRSLVPLPSAQTPAPVLPVPLIPDPEVAEADRPDPEPLLFRTTRRSLPEALQASIARHIAFLQSNRTKPGGGSHGTA